jgi:hypothetical protein
LSGAYRKTSVNRSGESDLGGGVGDRLAPQLGDAAGHGGQVGHAGTVRVAAKARTAASDHSECRPLYLAGAG